jgi:hypothetical protein
MERLPPVPATFPVPADKHSVPAGTLVWRIYARGGPHPSTWNAFRHFGPTGARFDHHTLPKRDQARGILYGTTGSKAILTALAEYFQDTHVIDRRRHTPWLVAFMLAKGLSLLDTTGLWPIQAGGNMAINSGSRAQARKWSRGIYKQYPPIVGIWYSSSLVGNPCIALYERARDRLPGRPHFNESLASPKLLSGLTQMAEDLKYDLK